MPVQVENLSQRRIMSRKHKNLPVATEELMRPIESAGVLIPQPEDVERYLHTHSDLTSLLPSVCKTVSERFGKTALLSLEIYRDPEFGDESLLLIVRQSPYDERVLEIIDDISDQYADEIDQASGSFRVTTDFLLQQKATRSVVDDEFEKQKQAFESISPEELVPYQGQFVAAIDGKIIDSDKDLIELDQRILQRYGDVPVYITKVGERAIFNIPTPFVR